MALRGPKPKPSALKLIAGNPGKRPMNAAEPAFEPAGTPAPDWLSDEAQAVWERVAPCLEVNGLLTKPDVDALATYCDVVGQYVEARRRGESPPMTVVTQIRQLASEFGFTPAARSRVAAPKRPEGAEKGKSRFFG
jgi:phage terminase small subunit